MASGELPPQHHTYSIYETRGNVGDFRFCMLRKMLAPETDINRNDHRVMAIKYAVRRACGSPARWYGLENSAIIIEYVPLFARMRPAVKLVRTRCRSKFRSRKPRKWKSTSSRTTWSTATRPVET